MVRLASAKAGKALARLLAIYPQGRTRKGRLAGRIRRKKSPAAFSCAGDFVRFKPKLALSQCGD